jgi:hypothetical protein
VCNLPSASGVIGNSVEIVKIDSAAGVIQIAPNGADVIANAGNVSIYIGQQFRHVTLQAQAAGQWIITGGEWQPAQAIDTNGSHIALGRLHHLPLNNTSRYLGWLAGALPAVGAFSSALQITGFCGVPSGAKAVIAKAIFQFAPTAAGYSRVEAAFSDNNTSSPSQSTSHSEIYWRWDSGSTGGQTFTQEIIIPLNTTGACYLKMIALTNGVLANCSCSLAIKGYYIGD